MTPVKIAQIGTGHDHAVYTMASLRKLYCFDVIGIAEPNPVYTHRLKGKTYEGLNVYTVDELLAMDDLEAVAIECEEENATKYAQAFSDKGVHVHLDKPGSHGYDSFAKMVETLRSKDLVLHMGYMYRYNPTVMRVMDMVRAGELGEIYSVEAHMSVHHPKEKHEWLSNYKGGMMYFLGCHDVDLVLQFMGGEPEEIIPLNTRTGQSDPNCEDYGFAVLKYKNGVSFVKSCAAEYNGFDRRQLVICGTKGTVEIKPFEIKVENSLQLTSGRLTNDEIEDGEIWQKHYEPLEGEPYDRYDGMMQSFADEIRGLYPNPYTYDYELTLFKTVMKCCNSD